MTISAQAMLPLTETFRHVLTDTHIAVGVTRDDKRLPHLAAESYGRDVRTLIALGAPVEEIALVAHVAARFAGMALREGWG